MVTCSYKLVLRVSWLFSGDVVDVRVWLQGKRVADSEICKRAA